MVLLGDDFSWQKAEMMYAAWEKLAAAANAQTSGRKVRVFFSTPSRYFAALRAEKTRLPTYSGELMPYADNERSCTPRAAAASALCVPRRPARPVPKLTSLASGRGSLRRAVALAPGARARPVDQVALAPRPAPELQLLVARRRPHQVG